jgi:hypothetical protein
VSAPDAILVGIPVLGAHEADVAKLAVVANDALVFVKVLN